MTTGLRPIGGTHKNDRKPALVGVVRRFSVTLGVQHNATERADTPSGCATHPGIADERAACADQATGFSHFLNHWQFVNRDTGMVLRFNEASMWPGQRNVVSAMQEHPWVLLLKAGKLGFTELECAFDGWRAIFGNPNMRVHIFSMDGTSAKNILTWVKFGLTHLPPFLRLPVEIDEAGGDTTTSLKLHGGVDDTRTIVSYAANKNAAIDQVAQHSHVDELARMKWPEDTWSSVQSTVAPGGTVHVVSRGAGDGNYMTTLYESAIAGGSAFYPHFEPFQSRPRQPVNPVPEGADPNEVWYEEQLASGMPSHQLNWLAPRIPEDALKGSGEEAFIPDSIWSACYDPGMPPLLPGDPTPIVLSADAGVSNDLFGVVAVSRHPVHGPSAEHPEATCMRTHDDPAIRLARVWKPPRGGQIDFHAVEEFIRCVCLGGCVNGHPNTKAGASAGRMCLTHPSQRAGHMLDGGRDYCADEGEPCPMCEAGERFAAFNVVQFAYDSYQLVDMAQRLRRDNVVWCFPFSQGDARMQADANLRQMAYRKRLAHNGDKEVSAHIQNANAKIPAGEETKLRIVKRAPASKIDLAVGASMAVKQAQYLAL